MGVETALIVGTVVSAASAISSGQQQKKIANYQAKQAEADANTEQQAAEIRAEKVRERARRIAASARAATAASGLSLDSETANQINQDIIKRGELDALVGVDDAGDAASRLREQATALRIKGKSEQTAGYAQAAGTALSNYTAYKSGWYGNPKGN